MAEAVRYRIKGTRVYVRPGATAAYETAGWGRRSIAMRAPNYGPNSAIQFAGATLRDQSRAAVRNNGYAKTMADRLVANIVGTGIVPQPDSARARALFARWTDEASADGTLDFYGLQAQVAGTLPTAGECFVRLRSRRPSDGLSVPLQLQVLEADFVPLDKNEILDGGSYIRQGIEFNAIGRRTAYWMFRQHPADFQVFQTTDVQPVRVPASEVLHVYDAISARPGQLRAEPWLTRCLAKLRDLDIYDDAELTRKKVAALVVGFIKRNVPEGMSEADLVAAWGDSAAVEDGVGGVTLEPGTMQYLEPGEEPEWNAPADVGGQYEAFLRQQFRALAAFAGILYEQLTGDYTGVNDRTWRAAFNEFKRRCEMWQHSIMVFQFCRPVWQRWASLARLSGALNDDEAPDSVKWIPQAWPYINPVQDVEAAQAEIRAGLASRSQKANERGLDAREIDAEQAADNASADKNGVKYDSDGRNALKSGGSSASADANAPDSQQNSGEPAQNRKKAAA